jgi:hypothetical protein
MRWPDVISTKNPILWLLLLICDRFGIWLQWNQAIFRTFNNSKGYPMHNHNLSHTFSRAPVNPALFSRAADNVRRLRTAPPRRKAGGETRERLFSTIDSMLHLVERIDGEAQNRICGHMEDLVVLLLSLCCLIDKGTEREIDSTLQVISYHLAHIAKNPRGNV